MTTESVDLSIRAHLHSSALLRRWLRETHTTVRPGPLTVTAGSLRLRTTVLYVSPTGGHRFGPIHVLGGAEWTDDDSPPIAHADPTLLAAIFSTEARARSVTDAPINTSDGSPERAILGALVNGSCATDPLGSVGRDASLHELLVEKNGRLPSLLDRVTDRATALAWLGEHVDNRLLPEARRLINDWTDAEPQRPIALLLSRETLAAIGVLGRYGVASEDEMIDLVRERLLKVDDDPDIGTVFAETLRRPTLTDYAALNGSELRYPTTHSPIEPALFEVPNPLFHPDSSDVPPAPVPRPAGEWTLRPVARDGSAAERDAALVHSWMHAEHIAPNWEQAWSLSRWRDELASQLDGGHSLPCLVAHDGREFAYVELYRVTRDKLGECYPHAAHDLGVHIAIGDPGAIGRGMGTALLGEVTAGLLEADARCARVVAEPNVHNGASVAAFAKAGYRRVGEVGLPTKNSALMIHERG